MIFIGHEVFRVGLRADNGSSNLGVDTTHADTSFHTEIALFTPGGTPTVLDIPEGDIIINTVTGHEDGMVEGLLGAQFRSADTLLVELEVGGIEGNREGTNFEELLLDGFFISRQSFPVFNGSSNGECSLSAGFLGGITIRGGRTTQSLIETRGGTGVAVTLTNAVGVGSFSGETTSLNDVFEGEVRPSTENTTISMTSSGFLRTITINNLFFTQRSQVVAGQEPLTFNVTGGRESPASTDGTLVLDGGDGTILTPVETIGGVLRNLLETMILGVSEVSGGGVGHEDLIDKFIGGHVRELIDAIFSSTFFIHGQFAHDFQILRENLKTSDFFKNIVEFLVISFEFLEQRSSLSRIEESSLIVSTKIAQSHAQTEQCYDY